MAFRLSREQLTERDALPPELRRTAQALNSAINAFNQAVPPLAQAVVRQWPTTMGPWSGRAPSPATSPRSPRTRSTRNPRDGSQTTRASRCEAGSRQWEMSLDDVDLELPEPLAEIDPEEHAGVLEGATSNPPR